jgi:preprotein translocase SecE subunit
MIINFIKLFFFKIVIFISSMLHELKNVIWIQPKSVLIKLFMILLFIVLISMFITIIDFFIHKVINILL